MNVQRDRRPALTAGTRRGAPGAPASLGLPLDSLPDATLLADRMARIIACNTRAARLFGYEPGGLLDRSLEDLIPDPERPPHRDPETFLDRAESRAMDEGRIISAVCADGRRRPVRVALSVADYGAERVAVASVRDATTDLRDDPADHRSRLAAVVRSTADAMITSTLDGVITGWNPAAQRIFGRAAHAAVGQHASVLTGTAAERAEQATFYAHVATGATLAPVEVVRRHTDGRRIDVSLTMSPITTPDGAVVGVLTIIRDITAQKAAQADLALSRSRLERAELTGRTGSWEWTPETGVVQWSAGLYAILGADPATADTQVEYGLAHRVHPDDRAQVRRALDEAAAELRPAFSRHRVIRPDGRVRTVELQAEPIVDPRGQVERLLGVVRDVTEETRVADALASASAGLAVYANELQRLSVEPETGPRAIDLSERQLEVLRLISQGLTSAEIARRMYLSVPTIKWHVRQILERTGASNRAEAVARVLGAAPSRPEPAPTADD